MIRVPTTSAHASPACIHRLFLRSISLLDLAQHCRSCPLLHRCALSAGTEVFDHIWGVTMRWTAPQTGGTGFEGGIVDERVRFWV